MNTPSVSSTSIVPSNSWVDRLRGFLLVSVLTGVVMLLYLQGVLSKDWLDRIGFLLNVCISLIFAPAVLDFEGFFGRAVPPLDRFSQRIDAWSRAQLPGITILFDGLAGKRGTRIGPVLVSTLLSVVILSGFAAIGWSFAFLLLVVLYPISLLVMIGDVIYSRVTKQQIRTRSVVLTSILFPFLFPVLIMAIPILFVAKFILQTMNTFAASLHGSLKEQERLRSSIIGWGIVIFMIANLFQFIASF